MRPWSDSADRMIADVMGNCEGDVHHSVLTRQTRE